MATCDVQAVMTEAKCFTCLTPGMWAALELALLCDLIEKINQLVVSGGVQQVFPDHYGASPPTFIPPKAYAVAPDLDAPFVLWVFNPDTQTWQ